MGLSFHYSGKIKDAVLISQLTEEVQDVCTILKWENRVIDDEEVKGIVFSPPECEPVFLSFNNQQYLCSPALINYGIEPATLISVKTQYAGIEVHKAVIKFLKHLEQTYFSEFELNDEGGYWETLNDDILANKFDQYNLILRAVSEHLKDFKPDGTDTAESLAERLQEYLNKRFEDR
jgi:hypothetical protein